MERELTANVLAKLCPLGRSGLPNPNYFTEHFSRDQTPEKPAALHRLVFLKELLIQWIPSTSLRRGRFATASGWLLISNLVEWI